MDLTPTMLQRIRELRREVRLADARPNDGRCGHVSAALEAEFGWHRECGYLRLLDGSVSWVHCWNRCADGTIIDATADQFGRLWPGEVTTIPGNDARVDHYLADPLHGDLSPLGTAHLPYALLCDRDGEQRHLFADDPNQPWLSLADAALDLVTGWVLPDRLLRIAAQALRARIGSAGQASTTDLIRPLLTESIQHLGRLSPDPWVAEEFRSPL